MPSNRPDVAPEVKRQEILTAARTMFFNDGFDKASVARIAREAGVTPNTLYWYFDSKDALFAAVMEELMGLFFLGLKSRDPAEPLDDTLHWVVQGMQAARPLIVTLHEKAQTSTPIAALHERFHTELAELLDGMLAERAMEPARIPAFIHMASFVVEGLLMHDLPAKARDAVIRELATF